MNPIENRKILEALNDLVSAGKKLNTTFEDIIQSTKILGIEAQKTAKAFDFTKTEDLSKSQQLLEQLRKSAKSLEKTTKDQAKANQELTKSQKERVRLSKQIVKETGEEAKQTARLREQLRRKRKENRDLAKTELTLSDTYEGQSLKLRNLRKEYQNLSVQTPKNKARLKELRKEITSLDKELKSIDSSIGLNQRRVGNYGEAIKNLTRNLLAFTGISAGISGVTQALREGTQVARTFELNSAKVLAVSGATEEQFAKLQEQAKNLGSSTAFSAGQVAELQLELSKLGFDPSQIEAATESVLNFAIATDSDLARSGEVVAATLNAFQLEASEAGRVADVAAKAFSSSALDIEKFATAISAVGPAANAVDVSLERTTAILGKIVDSGIDASTAGTALRNVFIDLADKGITFEDALNQINLSQDSLSAANELFGKRGAVVAQVIANNSDAINELDKSLQNAAGSAANAAGIIGDTLDGSFKKLTSAFENLFVEGSAFGNFVRGLVDSLTQAVGQINRFTNSIAEFFGRAKQEQESFYEQQFENIRTTKDFISVNQDLVKEFERLESTTKRNEEENKRLDEIKNQLLVTFDSSIAAYDSETDSISVNIEALKQKIIAEKQLQSESVTNLLLEEKRIKRQIEIAKTSERVFANIRQRITKDLTAGLNEEQVRRFFDAVIDGSKTSLQVSNEISREIQATGDGAVLAQFELLEERLSDLRDPLGRLFSDAKNVREALRLIDVNESELERIKEAFENLDIDFEALAGGASGLKKTLTDTGGGAEIAENSLEALRLKLIELKEQRDSLNLDNKDAIKLKQDEIDETESLIEQLEIELGIRKQVQDQKKQEFDDTEFADRELQARTERNQKLFELGEIDKKATETQIKQRNDRAAQIEREFSDTLLQIEIERLEAREFFLQKQLDNFQGSIEERKRLEKELFDVRTVLSDKEFEQNKRNEQQAIESQQKLIDLRKEEKQLYKEAVDSIVDAAEAGADAIKALSERRIQDAEDELSAIERRETALIRAIENGADIGKKSLTNLENQRREQEAIRRQELERQAKLEALVAILNVASQTGDAGSAIVQAEIIRKYAESLPGFYEGTELVSESLGKPALKGKDGHIVRVDGSERVVDGENNYKLTKAFGRISNDDLVDFAVNAHHTMDQIHYDRVPFQNINHTHFDTSGIMQELSELRETVSGLPERMPRESLDFDAVTGIATHIVEQNLKRFIKHYKVGRRIIK